jgi:cobalt-precorrin-7 (C5)-methyltransferase
MNKINIIGLGPGSREYITPAAKNLVRESDVIIGGQRNLESLDTDGKMTIVITNNLEDIALFVKNNYNTKKISIIASGDPGFFGILGFFSKRFDKSELEIIPGISSAQYFFAKLGLSWDDAYLGSLHGKDEDVAEIVSKHKKAAFLTDDNRTYRYIAQKLTEGGYGERIMYVGVNLSYKNEKIIRNRAKDFAHLEDDYKLCVVAVTDEK